MDKALDILKQYYGYSSFREGQEEPHTRTLGGWWTPQRLHHRSRGVCRELPARDGRLLFRKRNAAHDWTGGHHACEPFLRE